MVFLTKKTKERWRVRKSVRFSSHMLVAMTETDGLALAMLAMVTLAFGVILTLLVCMIRNSSRRDAEVDRLLEDFQEDEKKGEPAKTAIEEKKEDWEKDGDWWRG